MSRSYEAQSGSVEVVPVVVTAAADPTGGAVTFSFTLEGSTSPVSTFTAGTWSGSYNATTNEATALTPTLPAAAATVTLTVGRYVMRAKFIVSSETVIDVVGVLTITDAS